MGFFHEKPYKNKPIKIYTEKGYSIATKDKNDNKLLREYYLVERSFDLKDIMFNNVDDKIITFSDSCIYLNKDFNGLLKNLENTIIPAFYKGIIKISYLKNENNNEVDLFSLGFDILKRMLENIHEYDFIKIYLWNSDKYVMYFLYDKFAKRTGNISEYIQLIYNTEPDIRNYCSLLKGGNVIQPLFFKSTDIKLNPIKEIQNYKNYRSEYAFIKADYMYLYINKYMYEIEHLWDKKINSITDVNTKLTIIYNYGNESRTIDDEWRLSIRQILGTLFDYKRIEIYNDNKLIFAFEVTSENTNMINGTDEEICEHMINHFMNKTLDDSKPQQYEIKQSTTEEINTEFIEKTYLIIIYPVIQLYKNYLNNIHQMIPDNLLINECKEKTLRCEEIEIIGNKDIKDIKFTDNTKDNIKLIGEEIINNKKYYYLKM